jgi:hypothetical protein
MGRVSYKSRLETIEVFAKLIIALVVIIGGITWTVIKFNHKSNYTVVVTDKQVKRHDKKDKYMVYTEDDKGKTYVFEDVDSFFAWKWNSSDMYASIKKDHKYKLIVTGFRAPFFSMYPNIIELKEVK